MFWSFTKCWIWQQCRNCVLRHLQTLQFKAELIQKDFVVLYPDRGIDREFQYSNYVKLLSKYEIFQSIGEQNGHSENYQPLKTFI